MTKPITLFTATSGLNTKADPVELALDFETGVAELAKATNVSISDKGRPGLRQGFTGKQTGEFHSLYCDRGPCFVVQDRANDSAIMQVAADFSLSGVRSTLAKGRRVAFKQDDAVTYYSNGVENGVIVGGVSSLWPDQTNHVGPETSRVFFPAPRGSHLEIAHGRMWIIEKDVLWYSEPYAYGKFNKAQCYIGLQTEGRMVRGVKGGLWVSDEQSLWFYEGTNPADMVPIRKAVYPALEWSDAIETIDAQSYGFEFSPGQSVVLCTTEGLCVCGPAGEFKNIAEDKIIHPDSVTTGATLIRGGNAIHSIWC